MRAHKKQAAAARKEEEAPFDLANLFPRDTGLPMTVWVSPSGRARHDVRVKVSEDHGDRMDPANAAVVGVRPKPRLLHGELSAQDMRLVAAWIATNEAELVGYRDGRLSTVEFVRDMRRL